MKMPEKRRAASNYSYKSAQPEFSQTTSALGIVAGCPSVPSKMQRVLINKRQGASSTKTAGRLFKRPL